MSSICLSDMRIIAFDFDNTCAIHKNKNWIKHYNSNYYLSAYLNPITFYDEIEICEALPKLQDIVKYCKEINIPVYCITGIHSTLNLKAKENFVKKYYSDYVDVIGVSTQEIKIDILRLLAQIHKCPYEKILFIDDFDTVVHLCLKSGFMGLNVNNLNTIIK